MVTDIRLEIHLFEICLSNCFHSRPSDSMLLDLSLRSLNFYIYFFLYWRFIWII